jgi:hypothetical protein
LKIKRFLNEKINEDEKKNKFSQIMEKLLDEAVFIDQV